MSENLMPSESELFLQDFSTWLEKSPANLPDVGGLQKSLQDTEDKPLALAKVIKVWCREHGIVLDRKELAEFRVNMGKNLSNQEEKPEGEKPSVIYNKALIEKRVEEAKNKGESSVSQG
ncbi:hypothetical protein [Roseofilum capinflatum]|uniref:Uncharacterized protein n=1 Tax=Roseofilum capinflatum BLCC-M114 TaxID=3022440 RepID=A0ABT7B9H2_9CYAN|nr:hypothetical protein [Roseofilum capinflatum]MDJ1175462.1 hypothetical protein [Roseofilum capinflatum BLCC-M114]